MSFLKSFLGKPASLLNTITGGTSIAAGALGFGPSAKGTDPSTVDPFSPYRSQMVSQLEQLLGGNTSSITNSPEYQALLAQGTEAAKRKAAASGQLGSSNEAYSLASVGAEAGAQTFQDEFSLLSQFSGAAGFNPSLMASLANQQQQYQGALGQAGLSFLKSFL